jgi:hypothetical protein
LESLSITVHTPADLTRPRPVTGGVPLAVGAAPAGVTFCLTDPDGRSAPLQTEVLATWNDGSARWVLLDFQSRNGGVYVLTWDAENAPAHPQPVTSDPAAHTLTTAALALSPGDDALLRIAGRLDIDFVLGDADDSPCMATVESVQVETSGPLRSSLALKGSFRAPDGARLFQFRMRASVYAGLSLVHLEPLILVDAAEGTLQRFRKLQLSVRPHQAIRCARVGGDPGWEGHTEGAVRLRQYDDQHFEVQGDSQTSAGEKAPGWAEVDDGRGPVAVALRDFWQQWPKGLTAGPEGLTVGLFPTFTEGDYASMEPWYKYQYLFDGDCYRLRTGQASRWQLWIDLDGGGEELAGMANAPLLPVPDPAQAIATGVWDDIVPAGTDAMSNYDPWAANLFDAYCKSIEVQRDYGQMNWGDWFGERKVNWGNHEYDTPNQIYIQYARTGDPRYFYWADATARHMAEVDTVHSVNGDLASYFNDNFGREDYPPRPGMVHQHAVGHVGSFYSVEQVRELFKEVGNGGYLCLDPFNLGHVFTQGLARHYFLTGDMFVKETVEMIGDNLARLVEDRQYPFTGSTHCGRLAGWTLLALAAVYEISLEDRFLAAMKTIVEDALADQDPVCGGWLIHPMAGDHCRCTTARHTGMAGFITAVLINGLSRYYLLSGDERLPDSIGRAVTFLSNDTWREEWRDWRYTSCPASGPIRQLGVIVMAYVNAVRIADVPEHLRVLRIAWETKFQRLLDAPKPGPGQGKAYSSLMYGCPETVGLLTSREE